MTRSIFCALAACALAVLPSQAQAQTQTDAPEQTALGARMAEARPDSGEFFLGMFVGDVRDGSMRLGWRRTEDGFFLYDRTMMPSREVFEIVSMELTPELELRQSAIDFHQGAVMLDQDVVVTDGQARGTARLTSPDREQLDSIAIALPDGTLPRPLVFLFPTLMDQAPGTYVRFPWYAVLSGGLADVTITASDGGTIETPAGQFDTVRYAIRGGSPDNDVFVTRGDNPQVVRIDVVGTDMRFLAMPEPEQP